MNAKPPAGTSPRGLRAQPSRGYFFLVVFSGALLFGAFFVPQPHAIVIPPLSNGDGATAAPPLPLAAAGALAPLGPRRHGGRRHRAEPPEFYH